MKVKKHEFTIDSEFRKNKNCLDTNLIGEEPYLMSLWPTRVYMAKNSQIQSGWHDEIKKELTEAYLAGDSMNANWMKSGFFESKLESHAAFEKFLGTHVQSLISAELNINSDLGYVATGWANVKEGFDYHWSHIHEGHVFSWVYYIQVTGESADAHFSKPDYKGNIYQGVLELQDPRGSAPYVLGLEKSAFFSMVHIEPTEGLLVIFPSYLRHAVAPTLSDKLRISIAGNLRSFHKIP